MSSAYDLEMHDAPKPRPRFRIRKHFANGYSGHDPYYYTVESRFLFFFWMDETTHFTEQAARADIVQRLGNCHPDTYIYPEPQ